MTAYDDRGDMELRRPLRRRRARSARAPVFPFQFRYTPPASAVGSTVKLTAEAVDKAGNKSTRDLLRQRRRRRRAGRCRRCRSTPPTLVGTPTVGQTLTLRQRRVPQRAALATRTRGCATATAIAGATAASYTLTDADLGRTIACRIVGHQHGRHAVTRRPRRCTSRRPRRAFRRRPRRRLPPRRPPAPVATTKAGGWRSRRRASWPANRKSITCAVSSNTTTKFSGTIRLQGRKAASRSKSGTKKVTLTVRSTKALKKGTKVVLKLKSGKTTKQLVVSAR